ncbi:hypothetical protein Tco_0215911 [Tanacetum coccineum]
MLKIRDSIKEHAWYNIGNGNRIPVFYDKWCLNGPLCDFISKRAIYDARIKDNVVITDMVAGDRWKWPDDWLSKFPILSTINPPIFQKDKEDVAMWINNNNQKFKCDFALKVWREILKKTYNLQDKILLIEIFDIISNERNKNNIGMVVNLLITSEEQADEFKDSLKFQEVFGFVDISCLKFAFDHAFVKTEFMQALQWIIKVVADEWLLGEWVRKCNYDRFLQTSIEGQFPMIELAGSIAEGTGLDGSTVEQKGTHSRALTKKSEEYCSDVLYAVSNKEDTTYLCLHFTRNHEEIKIYTPYPGSFIRRILFRAFEDPGIY